MKLTFFERLNEAPKWEFRKSLISNITLQALSTHHPPILGPEFNFTFDEGEGKSNRDFTWKIEWKLKIGSFQVLTLDISFYFTPSYNRMVEVLKCWREETIFSLKVAHHTTARVKQNTNVLRKFEFLPLHRIWSRYISFEILGQVT